MSSTNNRKANSTVVKGKTEKKSEKMTKKTVSSVRGSAADPVVSSKGSGRVQNQKSSGKKAGQEQQKAESAKKAAVKPAPQKAEPAKKAVPEKKAEQAKTVKKAEPPKKVVPEKKAETAKKAEPPKSVKKAVPEKKAESVKKDEPVKPAKKAESVKKAEPAKPAKKAETVKKAEQSVETEIPVSKTAGKVSAHLGGLKKLKSEDEDAELVAMRMVLARRRQEAKRIQAEKEKQLQELRKTIEKERLQQDKTPIPGELDDIDDREAYKAISEEPPVEVPSPVVVQKKDGKTPDGKPVGVVASTKNDTMKVYMQDIGQISLVSKSEEVALAAQIHGEDTGAHDVARATLIQANLRLVVKIAHDFKGLGLPLLDLISEGNIGLMRAVEKFDPAKGAKFSSYAAWWIKQSMRRALANQSRTIRIPVQSAGKINKIKSVRLKLTEKLGREPTDAEIAKHLEFSERTVAGLRLADLKTFSLHDPIQQGEDGEFQDIIPDKGAQTPDRILGDVESIHRLMDLLRDLEERERMILTMRFGLDGSPPRTLEEVSQEIGRTRERVRQIQNQALCKLRSMLADEADFTND